MHVGDVIRAKREAASMTRNALAVRAVVDPAYLMRLERGDVDRPSFPEICKIADALGVSVDALRPETAGKNFRKKSV